ncbi:hypothetical protein JCM10213_004663 [Rhodosporidiobolus nylandii]
MAAALVSSPRASGAAGAKPLAAHPSFPLTPVELSRWNRFARKGGIGTALAKADKVSEDGEKDLMFLEGDRVVVLMDLGTETYLGFCEGVVGLFRGGDVQMQQAKLKRPVISPASSGSSAKAALPPRTPPRSATAVDVRPTVPSSAVPTPSRRLSRSASFDNGLSSSSSVQFLSIADSATSAKRLPLALRRKPVPEVEVLAEGFDSSAAVSASAGGLRSRRRGEDVAGLGIAVESIRLNGAKEDLTVRRRSRSVSAVMEEAQEILTFSRSSELPGGSSSGARHSSRDYAPSPAPSAVSSTFRTPSLANSPFSDFADDSSASSAAGSAYLGAPVTPPAPPAAVGWDITEVADARVAYLRPSGLANELYEQADSSYDFADPPTPTVEKLPMPQTGLRFPPPDELLPYMRFGPLGQQELPPEVEQMQDDDPPPTPMKDYAPSLLGNVSPHSTLTLSRDVPFFAPPLRSQFSLDTLSSSSAFVPPASAPPSARLPPTSYPFPNPPTHILGPDTLPHPRQQQHGGSAFSFSPNSSITSTLPPSIVSASGLAERREPQREFEEELQHTLAGPVGERREGKSSGSTISSGGGSWQRAGAPSHAVVDPSVEDPTLAFIYDSYYGTGSGRTSCAPSEWSGKATPLAESPVRELKRAAGEGYFGELTQEDDDEAEEQDALHPLASPPRPVAFGAASHLRDRIRAGAGVAPPPVQPSFSPSRTRHASLMSTSSSLDGVHIPRMSQIFPRSATGDSLTSLQTYKSSESGASAPLDAASPTCAPPGQRGIERAATPKRAHTHPLLLSPDRRRVASEPEPAPHPLPTHDEYAHPASPARTPAGRESSVPVTDEAHLAKDLAASRRLFQTYFSPPPQALADAVAVAPRSRLVIGLPDSPIRHAASASVEINALSLEQKQQRMRRKSAKGLHISAPVVRGLDPAVPRSAPLWRSNGDLPVKQSLPRRRSGSADSDERDQRRREEDVFVASPVTAHETYVEVLGHPPSLLSQFPPPSALPYTSSPSASSYQSFASAQSSPATEEFVEPPSSTALSHPYSYPSSPASAALPSSSSGSNKLRKGPQRMKSSPSLTSLTSPSVTSLVAPPLRKSSDPFTEASLSSAAAAHPKLSHSKSSTSLFGRRNSVKDKEKGKEKERTSPTLERKIDYSAGISHKDFEEETVKIGKSAFEMVKPYAALLGTGEEEDASSAADAEKDAADVSARVGSDARPSFAEDLATPRRPPPPSHRPAGISAYPTLTSTNGGGSDFSRSAISLSHFSPATPSSVEDGGKASVADHRAREARWLQVLGSGMTASQAKKSKKLRALVHSGVPSSVRGKVWAFLAEAEDEKKDGVYESLCSSGRPSPSPAVQRDLDSMLLDQPQFAPGTAGREDLESVLHAFARFSQQLVYYPGLANVVALLLSQMPAQDAFWTLCSLCGRYGLRQFFASGKEELRLELLAFGFLLDATEPKLAKRMHELSITPADYLPIWLSTLFLSVLPLQTTLRLVDLLLFDAKTRYRAPLALLDLSHLEDTSAFPSRDAVLNHLLAPPPEAFAPALLIPAVATMKLSDDRLKKAFKKAAQEMLKPQAPR